MKPDPFHRLHSLRMANDEKKYAMDEMRPRFEKIANRHTNGTAPEPVTAYQLFQTPPDLAQRLAALIPLEPGQRILEPSAGLGNLLDALEIHKPAEVVAVESSPDCTRHLYTQDRPRVTIKQRDFLSLTPADLGTFDAVVMNPPFHMRSDIRHIRHALQFLRPGGTLAALCMDTQHRADQLRPMASTWEPIPAGAFREAGTEVETILLSIKKCA